MKTSVIIPIYFSRLDLYKIIDRCIKSFKPKFEHELILVDDCSPIPCDEWPITIRNKKNLGFTKTVNIGLKYSTGDIIWVVNDDIEFNDRILDIMPKIKNDAIYTPTTPGDVVKIDKSTGNDDKFGHFWGVTRKTLDKLGYLDERFIHYYSDIDMWTRAKELGIKIIKLWDYPVYHHGGATYKTTDQYRYRKDQDSYQEKYGRID